MCLREGAWAPSWPPRRCAVNECGHADEEACPAASLKSNVTIHTSSCGW
jgi:hypothetical protein